MSIVRGSVSGLMSQEFATKKQRKTLKWKRQRERKLKHQRGSGWGKYTNA